MALSSTGTRKARDVQSRANDAITENEKNFIANLKLFSGESDPIAGVAGQGLNSSPNTSTGNYVAREGDSMIGALALGPPSNFRVVIAADDSINISPNLQNPQFSSNIELDSVQPNSLVLTRIDGAAYDGQLLLIRTFGPDSFTISQMTLANGGNIQTPNDDDFTLEQLQMILLVFDEALIGFANTGGTWRVLSASGTGAGGTGTYASAKLDQNQIANLALNNHFQFNDYVENGGIVLQGLTPTFDQTSGIFELKAGKTYFLYADASVEFNSNADAAQIVWYDITNAVELGQRASSDPLSSSSQLSNKHAIQTIITPVTDIDVEVRIVTLSGAINTVYADDSQVNIFEFSGKTGAQGPPGPAGSGAVWKDPARAKTLVDVPNLAAFDVITDGITLVQDDRVLLTEQTTASENGLYSVGVVAAGLAPLTRTTDLDSNAELVAEVFVAIEEGSSSGKQLWHLTSINPLTIGVSNQVWEQFAPGTSGSPNMGQGEDGLDGNNQYVFDGRIGIGFDRLKRWEQFFDEPLPDGQLLDMIYLPSIPDYVSPFDTTPGRLVASGLANSAIGASQDSFTYSDNYNQTWIAPAPASQTLEYWYYRMAYDPTGNILIAVARRLAGSFKSHVVKRSLDRGATWAGTGFPDDIGLADVIWSEADSQFVAVGYLIGVNGIWTSPDGTTWTRRTTPAPSVSGWARISYSETNGIYYVTSGVVGELMTSPDGINWTTVTVLSGNHGGLNSRLLFSDGHDILISLGTNAVSHISENGGVDWTDHTLPNADVIRGLTLASDLSLFVAIGYPDAGVTRLPIFWGSNDGKTWFSMPKNTMRIHHESGSTGGGSNTSLSAIAYAEEFGYFFGAGMSSNQSTSISYRLFRTEVSLNTLLDA